MSTYTPGPWLFVQGGSGDFPVWIVRIGNRGSITLPATAGMETMDADARLIAAAPELLEALKLMRERFLDTDGTHSMWQQEATDAADAAIAKATGETT